METTVTDSRRWLKQFGLLSFRRGQEEVIRAILDGHDTMCIMPTGGGKSLCYQLPSVAREGVTIVISPLIALMKDQVDSLNQINIPATFINSTLAPTQQQARIEGMIDGQYKLVYIAPERLRSASFMRAVKKTNIQFLAVDEAHCISQWGHDFRPDYARLGRFRQRIGNPQTVALTATATKLVQADIGKILNLNDPTTFVSGFRRENLSLRVASPNGNVEKDNMLIDFLRSHDGCGIIYASTRKNCEHLVELLASKIRRNIAYYHAGLETDKRREVQETFMSGETEIIVATNAFGMGIDKSDLRFVVHYNLPGSVEAYYQEAGRAGRDGEPADCLLLYSFQDKFIQEFFIENSYPSRAIVKQVYEYLRAIDATPIEMTLGDIKDELDLSIGTTGISNCENLLEKAGAIERLDSRQNMAAIKIDSDRDTLIDLLPRDARVRRHVMRGLEKIVGPLRGERVMFRPERLATELEMKWPAVNRAIRELNKLEAVDYVPPFRGRAIHMLSREKKFHQLDIDFVELERRKQSEYDKLQRVIDLATTRRCRQLEILEYFGDPDRDLCGSCDNCRERADSRSPKPKFADQDACLYAVQVVLSGAARTHNRFGKTIIAQMLTGSASKKIKQLSLNKLSTFGLLRGFRQTDVSALIEFLIESRYLEQNENTKFRPVVQITAAGREVMSGHCWVDFTDRIPGELVNQISIQLKGKQPHFVNESRHSVENEPTSEVAEELQVSNLDDIEPATETPPDGATETPPDGIDESRFETLNEVDSSFESHASDSTKTEFRRIRVDLPEPSAVQPSYYWTWRLLADGYSPEHLQQVRQIDRETIYDHVIVAMENNRPAESEWLLRSDQIEVLRQIIAKHGRKRMTELISELPSTISVQQLMYYLKCESVQ